jgi:protein TonB
MLHTLLESNAPRQRRRASTAASIAIHTVIIGGAIAATAAARTGVPVTSVYPRDTVIYVAPRSQPPPPAAGRPTSRPPMSRGAPPVPPAPVLRFDPTQKPSVGIEIDVGRLLREVAPRDSGGFGRIGRPGADTTGPAGSEPATVATVDRPAAILVAPRPRYPERLRAAGVSGRVVVRLVVDTTGRIEPASVVIRESGHDLFTQAVLAVIPSLRFTPAEAGGRRVRMLVDLPFEFRLNE